MKPLLPFLATIVVLFCGSRAARATDDPLADPEVHKALRAMKDTSTWYHPDLYGEFAGMRHYAQHRYAEAIKYFDVGAYYADKLSQLSIGLMHLNGEGTPKDPAMALAWFEIAAERGYPNFVATRDRLRATLDPAQLSRSARIREQLAARYGDAVAKPRMVAELRQGQMQMTGSRTGFNFGIAQLGSRQKPFELPIGGGTDLYARERWDPERYFTTRDAEWTATVTVGAVEGQAKPDDASRTSGDAAKLN
jgi:hypothetical protein